LRRLFGSQSFSNVVIALTMTNLIEDEKERRERVLKYRKALPKMLFKRGVDPDLRILDAGDHNLKEFCDVVISEGIKIKRCSPSVAMLAEKPDLSIR